MGLAPFFDRARQSAAQVLRDFDPGAFEKRLDEVTVTIAFDTHAATCLEGVAALDLSTRLIARLYPRVRVLPLGGDHAHADELIVLLRAINPNVEIVDLPVGEDIVVVAGVTEAPAGRVIYMGSDRWIARVGTARPLGFGTSTNPFGAGAAACIAVANVFRAVFTGWLTRPDLDEDLTISLLNFATGEDAANGDLPTGMDIGLAQLVGVGAIGNAFVWAMSKLQCVAGHLHLIDHEQVELTNLQRYVLPTMADEGAVKVDVAAAAMQGGGISATAFRSTWAEYVQDPAHRACELVAVALDTARDRVQVQSSLPRRIVNSWTQAGDLGISRHEFDGEDACLACLYLPDSARRNEDEIVLEELGFPPEQKMEIRSMLHFGTPVSEHFARLVASQLGIAVDVLLPFVGLPLRAFRQKAICGNAIMRAKDGGGADVEVPMAFQSALAGVMLAAEVVASGSVLRSAPVRGRTTIDLMRRLPGHISYPARKGTNGTARCICQDADYLDVYRDKYSA